MGDGVLDLRVRHDALDLPGLAQHREEPAASGDVVERQVHLGQAGRIPVQTVSTAVALEHAVLDRPVDLPVDAGEVPRLDGLQRAGPQIEHAGHLVVMGTL